MDAGGGGLPPWRGDVGGGGFVAVQQDWASDDLRLRVYAGTAGVQSRWLSRLRPDDWGAAATDDRWGIGHGDTELVCGEVWAYRAGGSYTRGLRQCGVDCSD